jgi:dTDP-4-dehydrorhamnose 3,5-epimerase
MQNHSAGMAFRTRPALLSNPLTLTRSRRFRRFLDVDGHVITARLAVCFVQDNHSRSAKHVLRGLHYQIRRPQGKLVRVISGEVFDVAVDLRRSSSTFGKFVSVILSADNKKQFWIPEGFAHGFLVLSDAAEFLYKTTDYYVPEDERCLIWNDSDIGIDWPKGIEPILSAKDRLGLPLSKVEVFA